MTLINTSCPIMLSRGLDFTKALLAKMPDVEQRMVRATFSINYRCCFSKCIADKCIAFCAAGNFTEGEIKYMEKETAESKKVCPSPFRHFWLFGIKKNNPTVSPMSKRFRLFWFGRETELKFNVFVSSCTAQ